MWVQSPSKKVSFCLIVLARVTADTLSASRPSARCRVRPGSYRDVRPLAFPLIAEETTTNPGGRGGVCEFGSRTLSASPPAHCARNPRNSQNSLNIKEKNIRTCAAAHRAHAPDHYYGHPTIELGMIPALGIGVYVRMFAVEGAQYWRRARMAATFWPRRDRLRRNTGSPRIDTPR